MTVALHYQGLAETADQIASGAQSSEAVTRHALDRIAALEPSLHAYAQVRVEDAIHEARAADTRQARGETLRPLHGVPLAVKDLCAMAGTDTRAGGFFPTRFAPTDTATVVARLQAAGAIIVGKTQLTEAASSAHHPDISAPVNPWASDYWSGTSSSGSGCAVAAGLAYGAIGTDTAGSIRFPSACNHLVGLTPTTGRVSRHGVFPLCETLDHVGPMARSVVDVALMFAAIAGFDPLDPTSLTDPASDYVGAAQSGSLQGVRIGLDPAIALTGLAASTEAAFTDTIALLKAQGAVIVGVTLPDIRPHLERANAFAFVEAALSHGYSYPSQPQLYSASEANLLAAGHAVSVLDYAKGTIWRREYRGTLLRAFTRVDLLITPVLDIDTPSVAEIAAMLDGSPLADEAMSRYTLPCNLAGIPSLTLPMGLAPSGAPLGFQLIGAPLAEADLLSAGAAYELASGFAKHHPPI